MGTDGVIYIHMGPREWRVLEGEFGCWGCIAAGFTSELCYTRLDLSRTCLSGGSSAVMRGGAFGWIGEGMMTKVAKC